MENTALNGPTPTQDQKEDWKQKKGYGPILVAASLALLLGLSIYMGRHGEMGTMNAAASSSSTSLVGSGTTALDLKTLSDGDMIVGGEVTHYGLRWYPHAPYDPNADDGQGSSWRRCGSGASVNKDQNRNPGFDEQFCDAGVNEFDMQAADDCQTVSPWGAQMLDGENSIFFKLMNGQDSFWVSGQQYWGVIKFFENTYCTGTGVEFYATGSDTNVPLDSMGHTPYENGFGKDFGKGGRKIRSFYVYAKPFDPSFIPIELNTIGFKLMPFPDSDMFPEDQTNCVPNPAAGGPFIYVPFEDEPNWPGLGCVSSFDRKMCFTKNDDWKIEAMYHSNADDFGEYGCVDFAGCSTCGADTDLNSVDNPNSYCYGSTLPSLNAFPLGSFFFNVYTIQGGEICEHSQMSSEFSNTMLFCDNPVWYQDWCITIKFYDCFLRSDCPQVQDGVRQATPDNPNAGPFYYISTKINDFCPGGDYGPKPGWDGGRFDNLDSIRYIGGNNFDVGNNFDGGMADDGSGSGWPLRATGYIAKLTYCQGDGSKIMDF